MISLIYFDNSATTRPFPEVIDSFVKVSSEFFGNPSSLHRIGGQAENLLSQAREQVASLLKVKPSEIYFTSGGTESNNIAIKGTALKFKNRGRHLITTSIEHPSVSETIKQLEQNGFEVTYLPVSKDGVIQVEDVENAIRPDTILVSTMYINNEVGAIQPIKEIGQLLRRYPKVLFHVDAVQAVGKVPMELKSFGVNLFSISAHKFHGLKGIGVLYIKEGVRITPLHSGGGQEANIRSGTENVAGAVAMAKALRMTMKQSENRMTILRGIQKSIADDLREIQGIQLNTALECAAPHIINFSYPWLKAETFIHALEQEGIFVSTTSACSSKQNAPSKTLLAMRVSPLLAERSIRISLSFENTMNDAEKFIQAVKKIAHQFGKVRN